MADIFVSYARTDKARVTALVAALESEGWSIWWDPEIAGGQEFDELITHEIESARAAVVVWTAASVSSRWVRGEARLAADLGKLVPVMFDTPSLPLDARAIHTIDLSDWREDVQSRPFQELVRSLGAVLGGALAKPSVAPPRIKTASICVLPFTNMSEDAAQEFFSDGISEDIITDLSKVSALHVIARNTAFRFKGKSVDIAQVARQTNVRHVLEGSVRKSGNRVRITAQLIDSETGGHIWAERYDRDLSDIFALQDEISTAIVGALKVRLLPEEKKALGQRGTNNAEAYELFLLSRQYALKEGARYSVIAANLAKKAVELDPNYAAAWARLAGVQSFLRGGPLDVGDPKESLERLLQIDPNSADARSMQARFMADAGKLELALKEIEIALKLDPDSLEINMRGAAIYVLAHRYADAAARYEKCMGLMETAFSPAMMLAQCYDQLGDREGAVSAAKRGIQRIEAEIARDPANGDALAQGALMWAALHDRDKCKEWSRRALIVDPTNVNLTYNLACALVKIGEIDEALGLLERHFETLEMDGIFWAKQDSDLDPIREHPRYKAMIARAEERLVREAAAPSDNAGAQDG